MANTRPKRPPSPTILSLLAAIAPPSVYAAAPPPAFLCPSIRATPTIRRRAVPPERNVPDRYEKDEDGMWRRVPSYTLYGLTCSGACQRSTNPVSSVDDNIQVPGSGNTSDPPSPTPSLDFEDTLPPGWRPIASTSEGRTPLILSLSLVLASLICFFIIGCLFWRTSRKRRRRSADLEARARRRRRHAAPPATPTGDDREPLTEKELKTKQKLWARATARWKANVRYTARQRRGKRSIASRLSATPSFPSLDNHSRSHLPHTISNSSSPASSRRSSTVSIPDLRTSHPSRPGSPVHSVSPPPSSHNRADTPSSPPAYQHRHQHNQPQPPSIIISASDRLSAQNSPLHSASRRPSHSSHQRQLLDADSQDSADLFPSSSLHVATDDKTLLARLATLASSPLEDHDDSSPGTSQPQVSAPVWDEDNELEAVLSVSEHHSGNNSIITNPPSPQCPSPSMHPLFPPLPSKERILAMHKYYDYSFSYEEMTSLEPEPGPSAPPFEETTSPSTPKASAPPLVPSAPPLEDVGDEDYYLDDGDHHEPHRDHQHRCQQPSLLLPSAPPLLDAEEEDQDSSHFAEDLYGGRVDDDRLLSALGSTRTATATTAAITAMTTERENPARVDEDVDVDNANGPKGQAHDREEPTSRSRSSGSGDEDENESIDRDSVADSVSSTTNSSASDSTLTRTGTTTTPPSSHSGSGSPHTLTLPPESLAELETQLAPEATVVGVVAARRP